MASWRINDQHTLRFGMLVQEEAIGLEDLLRGAAGGRRTARPPPTCRWASPIPATKQGGLYGVYVQDEWRILPKVTINGGLRFDGVDEYTNATQLSPRLNVVWKPTKTTTLHVGYARYFVPPPFELVGTSGTWPVRQHHRRAERRLRTARCCRSGQTTSTSASARW